MFFLSNHEQNEAYTFKYMLSQPNKSDFIMEMLKEVEVH